MHNQGQRTAQDEFISYGTTECMYRSTERIRNTEFCDGRLVSSRAYLVMVIPYSGMPA